MTNMLFFPLSKIYFKSLLLEKNILWPIRFIFSAIINLAVIDSKRNFCTQKCIIRTLFQSRLVLCLIGALVTSAHCSFKNLHKQKLCVSVFPVSNQKSRIVITINFCTAWRQLEFSSQTDTKHTRQFLIGFSLFMKSLLFDFLHDRNQSVDLYQNRSTSLLWLAVLRTSYHDFLFSPFQRSSLFPLMGVKQSDPPGVAAGVASAV